MVAKKLFLKLLKILAYVIQKKKRKNNWQKGLY